MPESLRNMAVPANGQTGGECLADLLRAELAPFHCPMIESHERGRMIKAAEPAKPLVAKDAFFPFIPIRYDIPNQAIVRVSLRQPFTAGKERPTRDSSGAGHLT
jgi:hypothetical protein